MTDNTKSITYSSTRGCETQKHLDFRSVVMRGLAHDRGLFVPDEIPKVSPDELESWRSLSYPDLAVEVLSKFIKPDQVPRDKLVEIVHKSCSAFSHEDVTPVVEVDGHAVLELFHGPTFAFKDVALQMLGNFFEYFLATGSNGGRLTVLGATSGDTGSAAIYGLRGHAGVDCFILFPNGRVSEIQERQMTTVQDDNIHCVAIDGTFDDCQDLVKASFNDKAFRERVHLGAVNSINWCRVLAQTTYYYWSYFRVTDQHPEIKSVSYSVPTGNFGDVLAGFYSKQMGLPVDKLVVATNENDILHRFFTTGKYHRENIQHTISPSMDICVSSNFERYLFHLANHDPKVLAQWMADFESTSTLTISGAQLQQAQQDFLSARADTKTTLETIKSYSDKHGYVLCPHSAVGVNAIRQLNMVSPGTVCLATAHEAKFPQAVQRAVDPLPPPPPQLKALWNMPTRRSECPNDLDVVQAFVEKRVVDRLEEAERKAAVKQGLKSGIVTAAVVAAVAVLVQVLLSKRK